MLQIRAFLLVLGELVHKHLPVYLPENQPESQKFYRTRKRTAAPTCMTVCQGWLPVGDNGDITHWWTWLRHWSSATNLFSRYVIGNIILPLTSAFQSMTMFCKR